MMMAARSFSVVANGWRYGVGLPCRLFQPYRYHNWQTALYRLLCVWCGKISKILIIEIM